MSEDFGISIGVRRHEARCSIRIDIDFYDSTGEIHIRRNAQKLSILFGFDVVQQTVPRWRERIAAAICFQEAAVGNLVGLVRS